MHQANPVTTTVSAHRTNTVDMAVVVALILVTIACYATVGGHEFVDIDDPTYIVTNLMIHDGVTTESLRWAFTTGYAANWHPLTWISHMVDCQLFGVESGPQHWMNLGFHCLNTVLLFVALRWMTGQRWPSAFVAGLFAVHPLHVESVAWVSERKDVLSTCFWMLTLMAYVWYVRRGRWWRYALVMITLALGLMAKPMLVTMPVVLLLLDYWPLRRYAPTLNGRWQLGYLAAEKIPLLALSIVSSLLTIKMQSVGGAVSSLEEWPISSRMGNAALAYVTYLRDMLWPENLTYFYPIRAVDWQTPWQWLLVAAAVAILAFLSCCAVLLARRAPFVLVGWLWYLITLVPVIGIVQVGQQVRADRYMYIPLIGPALVIAWLGVELGRSSVLARRIVIGIGLAAIGLCIPITMRQVRTWRDNEALFTHAIAVTSENHNAHTGLGRVLQGQGRIDEAIVQYHIALAYQPDNALANHQLGITLGITKHWFDSEEALLKAVALRPDRIESRGALAMVLTRRKRFHDAMEQYRRVITTPVGKKHFAADAQRLFQEVANIDQRIEEASNQVRKNPSNAEPRYRLARAFYDRGLFREAEREARIAVTQRPGWIAPQVLIAASMQQRRQFGRAMTGYQQILKVAPRNKTAKSGLREMITFLCHHDDVEVDLQRLLSASQELLKVDPDAYHAHWMLGRVFAANKEVEQAIFHFREALRLSDSQHAVAAELALLLATAQPSKLRNAREALRLAQTVSAAVEGTDIRILNALAAAQAETGDVAAAKKTLWKAVRLARIREDKVEERRLVEQINRLGKR